MKTQQHLLKNLNAPGFAEDPSAQIVLAFGSRFLLEDQTYYEVVKSKFPDAVLISCSTAGEILDTEVTDDSIALTAISFDKTPFKTSLANRTQYETTAECGRELVRPLLSPGLKHIMVLADGQVVNGTELIDGINSIVSQEVTVSGGLAGDGSRFEKTVVGLNDNLKAGNIVAIGFYGNHVKIGFGSSGGWDSFGPERKITRSKDNVLYELDGQSALSLYKNYLGDLAKGLPGNALLFPLALRADGKDSVVRTILSINEKEESMTFAGNMPEGFYVRLMKSNFDRLIDAASVAAGNSLQTIDNSPPDLAILISCVGRKLVLDQRVDEEVESVREKFGDKTAITGFYSYGELSPFNISLRCELHNQTMTITTLAEL